MGLLNYLENELGVKPEFARQLIADNPEIVERGERLGSYDYYVAAELLRTVPEDWEGFDPDFEPDEDDEEWD